MRIAQVVKKWGVRKIFSCVLEIIFLCAFLLQFDLLDASSDSGLCGVKGKVHIKGVSVLNAHGGFSKKLVLSFDQLCGFSNNSKKTKDGRIMHELLFSNLDISDHDLSKIRHGLTQLRLGDLSSPFERFLIKFMGKQAGESVSTSQLKLLLEVDPNKAVVKVSQASGIKVVEIEVFDCNILRKLEKKRNSCIYVAFDVENFSFSNFISSGLQTRAVVV